MINEVVLSNINCNINTPTGERPNYLGHHRVYGVAVLQKQFT